MRYPNLFKSRYLVLTGRDWLKSVMPDDQKAFIEIGLSCAMNGVLGGIARANTGKRYPKGNGRLSGRFMRGNS
jgi:hypothetical protein